MEAIYEKVEKSEALLSNWSVLRGFRLNRATYLEGLDLLRQDWSDEKAFWFLSNVASRTNPMYPRELIGIANKLSGNEEAKRYLDYFEKLKNVVGGEKYDFCLGPQAS